MYLLNLFITGITGFVGRAIALVAERQGMIVTGQAIHRKHQRFPTELLSIDRNTDWANCLYNVDCVIHCAARVHQIRDPQTSPLDAYREVNTLGTLALAKQSAQAGVKRFIFISSIKVNGEFTKSDQPFVEDVHCAPGDPYGLSKYEAEQGLLALSQETEMEVVIIRPPLVYGPGVKANFLSMMNWIYKKVPLPLGAIDNKRSLVFINNLVDFILIATTHPNAANQTFLVSDDQDVSVTQLLNLIANSMATSSMLIPLPKSLLFTMLRLLGKRNEARKLMDSLQLDINKAKQHLNWSPKYTFDEGVKLTVQDYLEHKKGKSEND